MIVVLISVFTPVAQADGLGTILGGVVGGAIGSRFGQGAGRDVAIATGAIGGATLGDRLSSEPSQVQQRVAVRRAVHHQQPVARQQRRAAVEDYSQEDIDPAILAAYKKGVADRQLREHKARLRQAYDYGNAGGDRW